MPVKRLAFIAKNARVYTRVIQSSRTSRRDIPTKFIPHAPAPALLGMPRGTQFTTLAELEPWHAVGLHTLGDLYDEAKLIQFEALVEEARLLPGQIRAI
ncbi:hypothetical protein NDU88_004985 [Pleurodeles waltl]|uniref:Uncharacterized protein n=1 Tax=Pleurodeles waltl TaxID=8319 RepID=A0AAV7T9Z3_PLEWA|nr:hypothetical protein NDU88_004985 [Pleurodeles waltl]